MPVLMILLRWFKLTITLIKPTQKEAETSVSVGVNDPKHIVNALEELQVLSGEEYARIMAAMVGHTVDVPVRTISFNTAVMTPLGELTVTFGGRSREHQTLVLVLPTAQTSLPSCHLTKIPDMVNASSQTWT